MNSRNSLFTRRKAMVSGAAAIAGALLAVLIGIPALRVPGLFLAVVTLALAAQLLAPEQSMRA